jgi:hypothetical protein
MKILFCLMFSVHDFLFPYTWPSYQESHRVKSSLVSEIKQVTQMNKHVPNAHWIQCQCQTQRQSEE